MTTYTILDDETGLVDQTALAEFKKTYGKDAAEHRLSYEQWCWDQDRYIKSFPEDMQQTAKTRESVAARIECAKVKGDTKEQKALEQTYADLSQALTNMLR